MKVDWRRLCATGPIGRNALCELLLREGYCADRGGGMKLIAVATVQKEIEPFTADSTKLVLVGEQSATSENLGQCASAPHRTAAGLGDLLKTRRKAPLEPPPPKHEVSAAEQEQEEEEGENRPILLSPEQKSVVRFVEQGENVFFSGSAGVGKSFLLKLLVVQETKRRGPNKVFCTSLTGLASCNIDGVTIYSFAGIGIGKDDVDTLARSIIANRAALRRWRSVELLFIDEVSMLDATLFEKLDAIARKIRNNMSPFGGIQICLSGDFFQIPPVGLGKDSNVRFCFQSSIWDVVITKNVLLTTVFRQKEQKLIDFLNNFRMGVVDRDLIQELSRKKSKHDTAMAAGAAALQVEPTTLFAKNLDVDRINNQRLSGLGTPTKTYAAYDWFRDPSQSSAASLNKLVNSPDSVTLAIGAQVILTKNLSSEIGLVNGSRGVVVGFERLVKGVAMDQWASNELYARCDPNEYLPIVLFASKKTPRTIGRVEFEVFEGQGQIKTASRCAVPLRLAWALSIHKSQGQTIDLLDVDLSGVFEYGQAFVALSRASTLEGLYVTGYRDGILLAHPRVVEFYKQLKRKMSASFDMAQRKSARRSEQKEEDVAWMKKAKKASGFL